MNDADMMDWKRIAKLAAGILIFVVIITLVGWERVLDTLLSLPFWIFPLLLSLYVMNILLSGVILYVLIKPFRRALSFWDVTSISAVSWAFSVITPAKLGQFSQVYFLKRRGIPAMTGAAVYVIDKGVSLAVAFLFAGVGFLIFFPFGSGGLSLLIFITLSIFGGAIIFSQPFQRFLHRLLQKKIASRFSGFFSALSSYLKENRLLIAVDALITCAMLFVNAIIFQIPFMLFGADVPILAIMCVLGINTFVSLIPLSPDGLGVRESVALILYPSLGVEPAIVISTYIVMRVFNYLVTGAIFLFASGKRDLFHTGPESL